MEKYSLLITIYVLFRLGDYVNSQGDGQPTSSNVPNPIAFGGQPNFNPQFTPNMQMPSSFPQNNQFGFAQPNTIPNQQNPNFIQPQQLPNQFNPQGNIPDLQNAGNIPFQPQGFGQPTSQIPAQNGFGQSTSQIPGQNNVFGQPTSQIPGQNNAFGQPTSQIPGQNNAFGQQRPIQTPQPLNQNQPQYPQSLPINPLGLNLNSAEAQLWFSHLLSQLSNMLNNPVTREGLIFLIDDLQKILSNPNAIRLMQLYTRRILQMLNQPNFDNFGGMQQNLPTTVPPASFVDVLRNKGAAMVNFAKDVSAAKAKAFNTLLGDIPLANNLARVGTNLANAGLQAVEGTISPFLGLPSETGSILANMGSLLTNPGSAPAPSRNTR